MDDEERSQTEAMIIASEGRRRKLYFDSLGHPSVGIGFNLERSDAPTLLQRLGADWVAIMDGKAELTDEQIDTLFRWCFDEALAYAEKLFPNWEAIIPEARMVLTDMSFQLHARLLGFVRMRDAVSHEDYPRMVSEMRLSLYAKQVPTRCARNAAVIEAAIARPKPATKDDGGVS